MAGTALLGEGAAQAAAAVRAATLEIVERVAMAAALGQEAAVALDLGMMLATLVQAETDLTVTF